MKYMLKKEGDYSYLESGKGTPLIILHGLMGNLSNFDKTFDHFSNLILSYDIPNQTTSSIIDFNKFKKNSVWKNKPVIFLLHKADKFSAGGFYNSRIR